MKRTYFILSYNHSKDGKPIRDIRRNIYDCIQVTGNSNAFDIHTYISRLASNRDYTYEITNEDFTVLAEFNGYDPYKSPDNALQKLLTDYFKKGALL